MMKKTLLTLALWCLFSPLRAAPSSDAPGVAVELLVEIERAVTAGAVDDLMTIRSDLESSYRGSGWLPDYTLAYVEWRIAQMESELSGSARKKLLKTAQARLDDLIDAGARNAEVYALRGSAIGDRIEGAFAGMMLGPKASASLEAAFEMEPENPRVAVQRGVSYYFTPGAFGGGLDKAEAEFRRAVALFENEPGEKRWPNWGRIDALGWLGKVLIETGDLEEARSLLELALERQTDHAWLSGELLPALERAESVADSER